MAPLLAVAALALCFCGAAAGAAAPDPLQAQEWWLHDIGADQAAPPGPGVPITIVDSGVDATSPEFADRPDTTFLNPQTVVGREEFHGTAVASVAAAPANGVGMVGVYPSASLLVWDASPGPDNISPLAAVAGVLAGAEHCPGVINLSFGGTEPEPGLDAAILQAVRDGCLVVAAAGNEGDSGNPTTYPASRPHVFTVAATDESDAPAVFSTAAPTVDVAAPGVDVIGAVPTTEDPSGYESGLDGTSFSAPIVSAAAAWVWTMRPTLTASQLAGVLRESARDVGPPGFDNRTGWGIVDIPAALAAPAPPPDTAEPNDDISQVKPRALFQAGEPPLTTPARPNIRVAGTLDGSEDPRDVYRIWVPARKTVRVSVSSGGTAAARIWGPATVGVGEGLRARRRDLKGPRVRAGKHGFAAYAEVLLTGRSSTARYTLTVKASRR